MRSHWSCSRFANWLRGTPKPHALGLSEWGDWEKETKQANAFRYWLAEEFLSHVEDTVFYIPNKINDVRYYLNNRYMTKTHALTSKLPRGQWHEFGDRVLHCLFNELTNFVEVEQAWSFVMWDEDARAKYAVPLTRRVWWLRWLTEWRCPEAGIAYLEWASSLTMNEFLTEDDPEYGKPSTQAQTAKETLQLYQWWTEIRPLRADPDEISGWNAICDKRRARNGDDNIFMFDDNTDEERDESRKSLDSLHEIEQLYADEDTEMLIRLIKIREGLWT